LTFNVCFSGFEAYVAPKRTAKIGNKVFLTRVGFKIFGIALAMLANLTITFENE
jgi:hypothetical protein